MSDSRQVSIRLASRHLDQIDIYCKDQDEESRSDFMGRCAVLQSKRILKRKAPSYVIPWAEDPDEDTTTITISLSGRREDTIVEACEMLHQKISLFIVWATIAELEKLTVDTAA